MRVWRFRRLSHEPHLRMWDGELVLATTWEIAFSQEHMNQKLNGEMAEVVAPAEPWWVRLWLLFRPRRGIKGEVSYG